MVKAALLSGAFVVLAASSALAASPYPWAYADAARATPNAGRVWSNGRCDGVSYGTGARRCDTMSGGPAGGISGRN